MRRPRQQGADGAAGTFRLVLEAPAQGARIPLRGRLAGFGWVLAPAPIDAIGVFLDDAELGQAETGLLRADLTDTAAAARRALPGFRFDCELRDPRPGPARLRLLVRTGAGAFEHAVAVELVQETEAVPAPQDGATEPLRITLEEARLSSSGQLHVRGWCVALRPLRSIEIRLGEQSLGRAEIGLPRGDVAEALAQYPNARLAGFALRRAVAPGQACGDLTAIATDGAGLTCTDRIAVSAEVTAAPPLLATLEEAQLDADGLLRVRGWAVSMTPLEQVRIHLGERELGAAELLVPRADVGLAYPDYPGSAQGGFVLHMQLPQRPRAGQVARAVVSAAGGVVRDATTPLVVAASPSPPPPAPASVRFFCDSAALTEDGVLRVKGWALCRAGTASLRVHLDATDLGEATLGEDRPDVALAFPDDAAARTSGFRFTARLGRACEGEHLVRLVVSGRDGEQHEAEVPVRAEGSGAELDASGESQAGIRYFLDQPAIRDGRAVETVRGFLSLAGWAFSAAGLAGIEVFVDGRSLGQAHRGIRREDLHKALGVQQALNAGFAMLIPPQNLPRGRHVVRVVIRDAAGLVQEIGFAVECEPDLPGAGPWALRRKMPQAEIDLHDAVLAACDWRPGFTLLLVGALDSAAQRRRLRATMESLRGQAWRDWSLVVPAASLPDELLPIADRVRLLADAAAAPLDGLLAPDRPGLFGLLAPGDELGEDALLELAVESALDRSADFLYADERRVDPADGETRAFFKPDFAPDLLLATNYIGRPWVTTAALLARVGATMGDLAAHGEYDLVLRLTEAATTIRHVPKVLAARGARALDPPATERRALSRALARRGVTAEIEVGCILGTWRVRRQAAPGRVSVIIPTAAARGLVEGAIRSIRAHTPAERIEIVVLDNIPPDAPDAGRWKDWLRGNADTVVAIDGPFNWSRFNNEGAERARGDFLLFLNDDIEVTADGWLDALLEHAGRPEVGAVGPLLLYPDGKVQHAGQFLAGSIGRHAFRFSPATEPGPFGLALTQRNVIAVTGACLLTRRDVFARLGGFDAQHAVINNDLDYCLRVREAGMAVIYTPYARLIHHEMASRSELGDDFDTVRFRARWGDLFAAGDPYFSPHLARDTDDYVPDQEPLRASTIGHPLIAADQVRRILAVKVDHIGDFIAAFPAFRRLKQAFPNAELSVLAAGASQALAHLEPAIDRVIRFDFYHAVSEHGRRSIGERELDALSEELAPFRFDLALDLRRQPDTRMLLPHTGARWLAGFDQDNRTAFLDIAVAWEGDLARTHKRAHISEALVAFVDAVAGACATDRRVVHGQVADDARMAAAALPALAALDFARPLVAIHAGAGAENKQWPAENFAALIDLMTAEADVDSVIIGGPDEAPVAEAVRDAVRRPERVKVLAGSLALGELPVLLRACALYVGNDSGPKHIAAALGVPTVAIHSGSVDATEWGPLGPAAMALRREMSCSPCYLAFARDCHRGLACLRGIRVGDVWRTARRLLALRAPPRVEPCLSGPRLSEAVSITKHRPASRRRKERRA